MWEKPRNTAPDSEKTPSSQETGKTESKLPLKDAPGGGYQPTTYGETLDHSFAHTAGIYSFMAKGASIGMVESGRTPMETLRNIPKNIKELQPDLLLSVPALAKSFRENIESAIRSKGPLVQKMFDDALETAYAYNREGGEFADYFPDRWLASAVGVLSEGFTEENKMMNSTMKIVRGKITEHYEDLIQYLYLPEARSITNAKNREAMRKLLQAAE